MNKEIKIIIDYLNNFLKLVGMNELSVPESDDPILGLAICVLILSIFALQAFVNILIYFSVMYYIDDKKLQKLESLNGGK